MLDNLMLNSDDDSQELRRLTSALLEVMPDPVLVWDQDYKLHLYNASAAALFALSDESLGKPLKAVVRSEALTAFARGSQMLSEWTPDWDGSNRLAAYVPHLQPVAGHDGETLGWVLLLHDITQLKGVNRSQNEFIHLVSHDLRSPLTVMRGFASMLEAGAPGPVNAKQMEYIQKILSGIAQMTAQVENIQDAGRFDPDTGFYEMRRSPCDLGEIAVRIVQDHLIPAEKQEIEISVSVADDVPIINVDSLMMERAISNLIDNAIKYTPNGGKIEVAVRATGSQVQLAVHDNGFGVSPDNQKLLFQRHVRIPRAEHKKVKGSGLGLFIVRSVARQHGGSTWVESAEGQGSTFGLTIPLQGANLILPPSND